MKLFRIFTTAKSRRKQNQEERPAHAGAEVVEPNANQDQDREQEQESEEIQQLKEAFKQFDTDGDGKISAAEMMAVMSALDNSPNEIQVQNQSRQMNITLEEAEKIVADLDRDGDGFVDLDEFLQFSQNNSTTLMNKVASCCNVVDASKAAAKTTTTTATVLRRREDLVAAFAIFDADNDGRITAEELWSVLRKLPAAPAPASGVNACFCSSSSGASANSAEFSLEDCQRMICGVDRKGLGHVDFEDFAFMMN